MVTVLTRLAGKRLAERVGDGTATGTGLRAAPAS